MSNRALNATVFYCSNHLEAEQLSRMTPGREGDSLTTVSLPCSGKVDIPYLIKAFETGAEGVVVVRCGTNECRHFEGNLRAEKRAHAVHGLLEEIGLDGKRITVIECPEGGAGQVLNQITNFMDSIRDLPQTIALPKESAAA